MREIIFRGKQKNKSGIWSYGYLFKIWKCRNAEKTDHYYLHDYITDDEPEIIPETIGQYTGLNDKNGTKIFEGDIVKNDDIVHNGEIQIVGNTYEIKFYKGVFIAKTKHATNWIFHDSVSRYKVIGNIYDNPELLSGK